MGKTISNDYFTQTINGLNINNSIPCSSGNYTSYKSRTINYITMHYTGNPSDTAKANCNYFKSSGRNASAHFFVDENNIYQSVKMRDMAWHCGANNYYNGCRNSNSIGIEMCTSGNSRISEKTKVNAAYLCASLCKFVGISANQVDTYVVRHYDVTHKMCPAQMVTNIAEWNEFKTKVKTILQKGSIETSKPIQSEAKKEDNEMVEAGKINVNGKDYNINKILKDGNNYIKLIDLKQAGFDVGYNSTTKIPSFGVSVVEDTMNVGGKDTKVHKIMKNNENYIRLRDLESILNIEYDNINKKVTVSPK